MSEFLFYILIIYLVTAL